MQSVGQSVRCGDHSSRCPYRPARSGEGGQAGITVEERFAQLDFERLGSRGQLDTNFGRAFACAAHSVGEDVAVLWEGRDLRLSLPKRSRPRNAETELRDFL